MIGNKDGKTIKFHDSNHKWEKIELYGSSRICWVRSFEKLHYSVVKVGYSLTNKKDIVSQLVNQVI